MKYAGRARATGRRIFYVSLLTAGLLCIVLWLLSFLAYVLAAIIVVWLVLAAFIFQFFRDPGPGAVPSEGILSPAWGRVDYVDETEEEMFMEGRCRRVSIFLSFFDVHVQNAPVSGCIKWLKHRPGRFFSTTNRKCSMENENLLIAIESDEEPGEKLAVRLIAGPIARRTVSFVGEGEKMERGQRMSLIRFGSRVDIFFSLNTIVRVQPGEKVRGGHTIIATRC
jgi:phosphatidylserine decarboxylase